MPYEGFMNRPLSRTDPTPSIKAEIDRELALVRVTGPFDDREPAKTTEYHRVPTDAIGRRRPAGPTTLLTQTDEDFPLRRRARPGSRPQGR